MLELNILNLTAKCLLHNKNIDPYHYLKIQKNQLKSVYRIVFLEKLNIIKKLICCAHFGRTII